MASINLENPRERLTRGNVICLRNYFVLRIVRLYPAITVLVSTEYLQARLPMSC